ncbi:DUF1826 domain-containing protein [Aliamphritea spongicola]|uniref:DUF1826 domain-containing protein n=1 Tax=Aliamphritea spongicola TaxID=707589 RepID=UPI00196A3294|nr:DUF1826 domain-containing protein [Aliamphritea spongicola]MBN3561615.1 DUF1826 domain-containing protein [Aliamphritea spongicola]
MTAALALAAQPTHVCSGDQPVILSEIYQPDLNLVYWQRQAEQDGVNYARFLAGSECHFTSKSTVLSEPEVAEWLNDILPEHPDKAAFSEDVAMLADMFSYLFDLPRIGIRLQVLQQAMCPKFHVDKVPCRLVTTYTGATTEWRENAVDGDTPAEHSVPPHSVVLLKGDGWWQNEGRGIVHRSPAASPEEPRVFLSFDFAN